MNGASRPALSCDAESIARAKAAQEQERVTFERETGTRVNRVTGQIQKGQGLMYKNLASVESALADASNALQDVLALTEFSAAEQDRLRNIDTDIDAVTRKVQTFVRNAEQGGS